MYPQPTLGAPVFAACLQLLTIAAVMAQALGVEHPNQKPGLHSQPPDLEPETLWAFGKRATDQSAPSVSEIN